MTIEFPKFPNKRRNNSSVHPTQTQFSPEPVPPVTPDQTLHLGEQSAQSAPAITDAQLAELQASLKAQQATHRKKSKLLPALAGVLVLGALGAVAYPMYQTMAEEKAVAATPAVAPKPSTATKPISAPATTGTASASAPVAAPVMAVTPTPASSSTPTSPNAPEAVLDAGKTDDLQKPLLVDNSPANSAKPDSAKSDLAKDTAPTAPATLPKANATPEAAEAKPDSKSSSKSDTTSSQTAPPKPATSKNTMSYDEFVKASDSAVYIEPPTKQK